MEFTYEFVEYVRKTTRACQFDFIQVAQQVNASAEGKSLASPITAEICRHIFAQDYSILASSKQEKPANASLDSSSNEMSIQDILLQTELRQLENDKKIEKIFQRVLNTLETADTIALDEDDEIVLARQRYKENKAYEKYKKEQAEELHREQLLLEEQRLALSRRFDEGSEDAQGIDPFATVDSTADSVLHEIGTFFIVTIIIIIININITVEMFQT
jgi:hypothetical protein